MGSRYAACCLVLLAALTCASVSSDECVSLEKEKDAVCLLGLKAACGAMTLKHTECNAKMGRESTSSLVELGDGKGLIDARKEAFLQGYQEGRSSKAAKVRNPACSGWAPTTGKFKGIGKSCTCPPGKDCTLAGVPAEEDWCWTREDYAGPVPKQKATEKIDGKTVYFSVCPRKGGKEWNVKSGINTKAACKPGYYKAVTYGKPQDAVKLHNVFLTLVGHLVNVLFPSYKSLSVLAPGEKLLHGHEAFVFNKKAKEARAKSVEAKKISIAKKNTCSSIKSSSDKRCQDNKVICSSGKWTKGRPQMMGLCMNICEECADYRKQNEIGEARKKKSPHQSRQQKFSVGSKCCQADMDLPTSVGFPSCWGGRNAYKQINKPDSPNLSTTQCVAFEKEIEANRKARKARKGTSVLGEGWNPFAGAKKMFGQVTTAAKSAAKSYGKSMLTEGTEMLVKKVVAGAPPSLQKLGLKKSTPFLLFAVKKLVKCALRKDATKCFKDAKKEMLANKTVSNAWNEFLGFIRNAVYLKLLNKNPCSLECVGTMFVHNVFDAFHKTTSWLPGENPHADDCAVAKCERNRAEKYAKNKISPVQRNEVAALYDFQGQAANLKKMAKRKQKLRQNAFDIEVAANRREKLGKWSEQARKRLDLNPRFARNNAGKTLTNFETPGINWFDFPFSQQFVWPNVNKKGAKTRKDLGLGKYPAFKTVQELLDSSARTFNIGRFSRTGGEWDKRPVCTMKVSYYVAQCSNCCCLNGLTQVYISTKLTKTTGGHGCKMWFGMNDAIIRSHLGISRAFDSSGYFKYVANDPKTGRKCFDN